MDGPRMSRPAERTRFGTLMAWSRLSLVCVLSLAAGCAWDTPLRRRRDAALLQRNDLPRQELRSPDVSPPPPLVTDTLRVYANPAENQDGGLELQAALVEGLRNSRIVVIVDGGAIGASRVTGYDGDSLR